MNIFHLFKANLILIATLSGYFLFFLHICILNGMFQGKFDIMILYVKEKQQIFCQSVYCNGASVLTHCVKNELGYALILIDATVMLMKLPE